MGKSKNPATGEGFLGEIMVHKISRAVGVVEHVNKAQVGWPPQIILKVADGTVKKGRLCDFREPSGNERAKIPAELWPLKAPAAQPTLPNYPLL